MTTFRYRAYDTSGKSIAGSIEADGYKSAVDGIKKSGLFPTDVNEAEVTDTLLSRLTPLSSEKLALTTRQFSTLLASGSTMTEALGVLSENTSDKRLSIVLLKLREDVVGGATLSKAIAGHPDIFSPFYCGLVSSAEASGNMDTVLSGLADYLEARARTIRELKTALTYPALMLLVGTVVLAFLFVFVVPKITRIFEETGTALPWITRVLIWVTGAALTYWPLLLIATAASIAVWVKYRRHPALRPFVDRFILNLPWVGPLATSFYIATMTRTLGSLLSGGVQLLGALEITKGVLNSVQFKKVIDKAITECAEGSSLSASLKSEHRVPSLVTHMVNVGEKSGNLEKMLLSTATSYEEQFSAGLKRSITLIEPLMILGMGLVVGLIVLAILLPIFELNQIIR